MNNEYSEIDELNNNSNLKYPIGSHDSNFDRDVYEKLRNFMSLDYYFPNKKEQTRIICFYGFPTDESDYLLSSYETKSSEDNVFGVSVGMDTKKAEEILAKFGYKKVDDFRFKKGVIKIDFECNNVFDLPDEQNREYVQLGIKKREGLLTDEDKIKLKEYEDYKNTICQIKVSLESKYLGNRLY